MLVDTDRPAGAPVNAIAGSNPANRVAVAQHTSEPRLVRSGEMPARTNCRAKAFPRFGPGSNPANRVAIQRLWPACLPEMPRGRPLPFGG